MLAGRLIGRLFWALAFMAAGAEIVRSLAAAGWRPLVLGEVWHWLDVNVFAAATLGLLQAGIQRHVWPTLWDPVVLTMLLWPAWAYGAVLGALLVWLFRARRDRRIFWRR